MRRFRRVSASVRVAVGSDFHDSYELSCGGFSVEMPRPLRAGTRATFQLHLEQPVEVVGVVTWAREGTDRPGMGVAIVDASLAGREWLESYVDRYCERVGRPPIGNLGFYKAYNLFRVAAIVQGIVGRARQGNAAAEGAAQQEARVRPLAEAAWGYAREAGAA